MKKILLLSAFLCLSIPTFAQTEGEPIEITAPNEGDEVEVTDADDTVTYRTVNIRITMMLVTRPGEWEGFGFDAEGNYWHVQHYGGKTIGRMIRRHA